jgi:hypothetical protein
MNRKYSVLLFLCVCLILAVLLLTEIISFIAGTFIFAIALLVIGFVSNGFQKK